jgi:hypothetical protein
VTPLGFRIRVAQAVVHRDILSSAHARRVPLGSSTTSECGRPSNVEFGVGDEANVLYVTVDLSLYRIPLSVKGHRPY